MFYFGSLFVSFLGPCWFYVNRTNFLRHGSMNMSRKLVLMICNVLFLLVRAFAITSAIFIPVIKSWDAFIKNQGQLTKRARSGRKREKALSRLRSRLSRDGQSANTVKSYKRISLISLWEPEEKHHSTCRVS